jgi:hypothetical protein
MFKTTIGHLTNATSYFARDENGQPIEASFGRLANAKLPAHLAFRLAKLAQSVESSIQTFQKLHQELIDRYATTDGEKKIIASKDLPAFNEELNAMLAVEVELPGDKLNSEQLAFAQISTVDILALQWLFSDFETSETAEPEPKKKKLAAVK